MKLISRKIWGTESFLWVGNTAFPRRWYCIARSLSSDSLVLIHKMMILLMLLLLSIVRKCIEWQPSYGWWKWRLPLSWNYSKTSSKKPDWWPRFIFTSHSVKITRIFCHPQILCEITCGTSFRRITYSKFTNLNFTKNLYNWKFFKTPHCASEHNFRDVTK